MNDGQESSLPIDLGNARVLVVNDDGIDSAGLALLERTARRFTDDVWTVAPQENQSARGRAYTLRRPVACQRRDERRYAVAGTPVDCVLVALNGLIPGRRPDLASRPPNDRARRGGARHRRTAFRPGVRPRPTVGGGGVPADVGRPGDHRTR